MNALNLLILLSFFMLSWNYWLIDWFSWHGWFTFNLSSFNKSSIMRLRLFRMIFTFMRHNIMRLQVFTRCSSSIILKRWFSVISSERRIRKYSCKKLKLFNFLFSLFESLFIKLFSFGLYKIFLFFYNRFLYQFNRFCSWYFKIYLLKWI